MLGIYKENQEGSIPGRRRERINGCSFNIYGMVWNGILLVSPPRKSRFVPNKQNHLGLRYDVIMYFCGGGGGLLLLPKTRAPKI